MKRCPRCNRVETNDSLTFCRVDGSPLTDDTSNPSEELGTIRFGTLTTPTKKTETLALSPRSNRKLLFISAAVIAIVGIALCVFFFRSKEKHLPIQSIAVMPFVNESRNENVDYLSDGMTDTLISTLSQLNNLSVKARSSVFRYKGKDTSPQTIGKELNVQAILNGRFAQRGDQLTLTLELVDAQSENVIWSEQYNRAQTDLVNLQTDIARDVSSKLKTKLSGTDAQKLAKTYTTNPEAYRLYLQGRFYWNKREEKDLRNAIDCFNQAIALDSNYALAYSGLADSYMLLASFGYVTSADAVPKARGYALKVLSLDENLAEPHTTLGLGLLQYDYDVPSAEREYKRAIELNPNYATAHQWYGELLACAGRFEESAAEFRRALELEPLSLPINWDYGRLFYDARKYDEAIAQHKKTLELDPGFARARRTLVEIYRVKKDYSAAIEELGRFFEVRGQPENAALVREAFAKGGWPAFLQLVVAKDSPLKERPWIKAKAYVELGNTDKAFEELNTAYALRESSLSWLKVDPLLEPLRSDPRYQQLLSKIKFAP